MTATRILLADDHALVRQGIRSLLAGIGDFDVVGEAHNGREAIRLIRLLAPDVALMDISMPELNGLDTTVRALHEQPHLKVIILSMHATEGYVLESLRAGAAGYLLKEADAAELERAIRAVVGGHRYLSPSVSHHVVEQFMRVERGETACAGAALSARQREVLQLIAESRNTREIAQRLHLSVKTIETHRSHLMQSLEIYDVAGLTRYALRNGMIDLER